MPFGPNNNANPKGAPRGPKADKPVSGALRTALFEDAHADQLNEKMQEAAKAGAGFKKLRVMATRLVDDAIAGNTRAAEIIFDRMEGKVKQQTELVDPNGDPAMFQVVFVKAIDGQAPEELPAPPMKLINPEDD